MTTAPSPQRGLAWFLSTSLLVLLGDQASKAWILAHVRLGQCYATLLGFLDIRFITNRGAAFGMLQGSGRLFVVVAALVLAGMAASHSLIRKADRATACALGLLAGGTVGNVIDRVRLGYVVDFFDLRWWPVFNVADSAICVAVALMMFKVLRSEPDSLTPQASPKEASESVPPTSQASLGEAPAEPG